MSLCRLMVLDYLKQTGRFDGQDERYDDDDLGFGINYAQGLIEDGYITEPFYNFNLKEFIKWCKNKIDKI